jgi:hypothetical protein
MKLSDKLESLNDTKRIKIRTKKLSKGLVYFLITQRTMSAKDYIRNFKLAIQFTSHPRTKIFSIKQRYLEIKKKCAYHTKIPTLF